MIALRIEVSMRCVVEIQRGSDKNRQIPAPSMDNCFILSSDGPLSLDAFFFAP